MRISYCFVMLVALVQFILCETANSLNANEDSQNLKFFSNKGRVFAPLVADPRESQFRFGFMYNKNGHVLEDIAWGGDLGFLNYLISDNSMLSVTGRGVMTARFDFISKSFDLQNINLIGGMAVGYSWADWSFETFLFHQSSHLGDEIVERGDRKRIDYGIEEVRFLWSYLPDHLRLYGGATITVHAYPSFLQGKVLIQIGCEYHNILFEVPVYSAIDLQANIRKMPGSNIVLQTGADLGEPGRIVNRQRIFIEFFTGYSSMGQFFNTHESYILLGLGYNFR